MSIEFVCRQCNVTNYPQAERISEMKTRKGMDHKTIYGFKLHIHEKERPEDGGIWESTPFVLIAASQKGLHNIYRIASLVNHDFRAEVMTPGFEDIKPFTEGLIFAKHCKSKRTGRQIWELREGSLSDGKPVAVISDFDEYGLQRISMLTGDVHPVSQTYGSQGKYWPHIDGLEMKLIQDCCEKAHSMYGNDLPEKIRNRLDRELKAITGNGYAVIFYIAQKLAERAESSGELHGYRGGAGSSLAAYLTGISEFNPLPPHYICPVCHHYEEPEDASAADTLWDLPEKICPVCGNRMRRDGYNIPCEAFFGLKMDHEPDIDITVEESHAGRFIQYLAELFGKENLFRSRPDLEQLCSGEYGIFILPEGVSIYDFTPLEGAFIDTDIPVTAFRPHELDQHLFKQDIISSTSLRMLGMLGYETWEKPDDISLDESGIAEVFTSACRSPEDIDMATSISWSTQAFKAMNIIEAANARTVSDFVRVAGLLTGAGAWNDDVEELIKQKKCRLRDLITCREDILSQLTAKGLSIDEAYSIMCRVRIGRALSEEQISLMRGHGVPDWYIRSCGRIRYLSSRAAAVSKAVNNMRLAWFKANYPEQFLAVWQECSLPDFV